MKQEDELFVYLRPYVDFRHPDWKDPVSKPRLTSVPRLENTNVLKFDSQHATRCQG